MPRLFISHSSQDNFEAQAFHDWLVSEGWAPQDIFLGLHDIGAGARWKEALAKANERCEAVVLLASAAALASTECRLEIRMAEDYGKEIVVALLPPLKIESEPLGPYRERQIADLGLDPRDAVFTVENNGRTKAVTFSARTLRQIKARLDQLGISPTSFVWRPKDLESASPYPGFESFTQSEAALFFGRSGDIARGLAELRRLRRLAKGLVMVIQAASGAGKSSFLKAGLWPRLARDPEFLPLALLRPATGIITGEHGLGRELSTFFASHRQSRTPSSLHRVLRGEPDAAADALIGLLNEAVALGHAVHTVARPDAPAPTPVIAVDQAEELFATADAEESRRFLDILASVLAPERSDTCAGAVRLTLPPLLVWTIRADSLDTLLHAVDATGLAPPQAFVLPPIPREAYREIIEQPAVIANKTGMKVEIDPLLTESLVKASTGADALPLLAFSLRQLMAESRVGKQAKLTLAEYEAAGGIDGILRKLLATAQRAAGSSDEDLRRLIVPSLATWDEEAKPPAAKRLVADEGLLLSDKRAELKALADELVEARLLTRAVGEGGKTTLEVAHESLLRQSPISNWLAEDADFLAWLERVSRARELDEVNFGQLVFGASLETVESWLSARSADIPESDRWFVEDSIKEASERRLRDEEASHWLSVNEDDSQERYEEFLKRWPTGQFTSIAQRRLKELVELRAIVDKERLRPAPVSLKNEVASQRAQTWTASITSIRGVGGIVKPSPRGTTWTSFLLLVLLLVLWSSGTQFLSRIRPSIELVNDLQPIVYLAISAILALAISSSIVSIFVAAPLAVTLMERHAHTIKVLSSIGATNPFIAGSLVNNTRWASLRGLFFALLLIVVVNASAFVFGGQELVGWIELLFVTTSTAAGVVIFVVSLGSKIVRELDLNYSDWEAEGS